MAEQINLNNLKDIAKQFDDLTKENARLNALKEKYIVHAASLKSMCDKMRDLADAFEDVAEQIDPVIGMKGESGKKRYSRAALFDGLIQEMRAGQQVTREYLEKKYPDYESQTLNNILSTLGGMQGVDKAKDGNRIRLFCRVTTN